MNTTNMNKTNTDMMKAYCVQTCKATRKTIYGNHTHLSTNVQTFAFADIDSALNLHCVGYVEYLVKHLGMETVFTSDDAFQQ